MHNIERKNMSSISFSENELKDIVRKYMFVW